MRPNVRIPAERAPAVAPPQKTEARVEEPAPRALPFRLRTVLVLGLIGAGLWSAQPRAEAAWKLNSSAATLANYALCMVGPTGPALLRDGSPQFKTLVRRRLVSSEPGDRPFSDCAKMAFELTASSEVEQVHRAQAWSFVEYGGVAAERARAGSRSELRLDALGVSGHALGELAKQAWPFVRGGYVKLVKPSMNAREAVHPIALARPGVGRGLPPWRTGYRAVGQAGDKLVVAFGSEANLGVFQSSDRGLTWRPAAPSLADAFSERCPAGDHSYTFSLADDSSLKLSFRGPSGEPGVTSLAKPGSELLTAACDQKALVALVRAEGSRESSLVHCDFGGPCRPLTVPRFPGGRAATSYPLDVARVEGATLVAVEMHGIVRVASSRDDGKSWTSFVVAYDDGEPTDVRVDSRVPSRLLVLGKQVLLYAGAPKPAQSYTALVSDDLGASWRTPDGAHGPLAAK